LPTVGWRLAVRGIERIPNLSKRVLNNQKPLKLPERCIEASSEAGDVVVVRVSLRLPPIG